MHICGCKTNMHVSYPRTSMASLTANGKPHKGLMLEPFAALASIAAASSRTCSQLCGSSLSRKGKLEQRSCKALKGQAKGAETCRGSPVKGELTWLTLYVIHGLLQE